MRGIFSNGSHMKFFLMIFPRIGLHCKLVSVQYREYENRIHYAIYDIQTHRKKQRITYYEIYRALNNIPLLLIILQEDATTLLTKTTDFLRTHHDRDLIEDVGENILLGVSNTLNASALLAGERYNHLIQLDGRTDLKLAQRRNRMPREIEHVERDLVNVNDIFLCVKSPLYIIIRYHYPCPKNCHYQFLLR